MDLTDGKLISPTIEETRTNVQFLAHVQRTVATDPGASWVFIVDNLDTHKSPELVEWVATTSGVIENLGKKFVRGHLRNRASRTEFLRRSSRFSKLARAVLRRGSFTSQADLEARLRTCINYYFVVEARPHRSKTSADDMLRKMRIGSSELLS